MTTFDQGLLEVVPRKVGEYVDCSERGRKQIFEPRWSTLKETANGLMEQVESVRRAES